MSKKKIKWPMVFLMSLLIIGFFYRIYGLSNNYSFWSDEDHVAIFSKAILDKGKPVLENGYNTGMYQFLLYWITAGSMKIFGINEFSARLPSVFFGVLTVLAVYLLGRELFDENVGLLSAFLIAVLNIEILYSRQVRPYQALQLFFVLGGYFAYKISNLIHSQAKEFRKVLFFFIFCGVLASLFHGFGLFIFFYGIIYLFLSCFKKTKLFIFPLLLLFFIFVIAFFPSIRLTFLGFKKTNNFTFYYKVFLTHNYLQLIILALIGFSDIVFKRKFKVASLFICFLVPHFIILSALFSQPFIRYFYPVFPFLIILSSYGIFSVSGLVIRCLDKLKFKSPPRIDLINTEIVNCRNLIIIFFISLLVYSFLKRDKISLFPKSVYSLNADMQEVPEVDWKKIYGFVGQKLEENPGAVLVTNWNDLPVWYLGEGRLNYLVRKDKIEKDSFSGAYIINSLDEFIKLLKTHKKGFFVLDSWDNIVPDGIREYCHKNLKRELEIDRLYPVQPRFWTVWVYSWGMD